MDSDWPPVTGLREFDIGGGIDKTRKFLLIQLNIRSFDQMFACGLATIVNIL
jgi:hypothetical protein